MQVFPQLFNFVQSHLVRSQKHSFFSFHHSFLFNIFIHLSLSVLSLSIKNQTVYYLILSVLFLPSLFCTRKMSIHPILSVLSISNNQKHSSCWACHRSMFKTHSTCISSHWSFKGPE